MAILYLIAMSSPIQGETQPLAHCLFIPLSRPTWKWTLYSPLNATFKDVRIMPMRHYKSSVYTGLPAIPALGMEQLSQH